MKKTFYSLFTACLLMFGAVHAQVVATLAGSGTAGSANGIRVAASFNAPTSVCFDYITNDIIVADRTGHKIRRISPSGVVSTLAGSGSPGSADGTGTAASFNFPTGVCVDLSGNVYVADFGNNKIRHITPAGVVTTYAGTGAFGSAGGLGNVATFANPTGICTDYANTFYVVDYGGNNIRKISGGVVSVFAGSTLGSPGATDATGTSARFNDPWGICIDQAGALYVADGLNNKIRKINTTTGAVTTLAGSGATGSANGTGTAATFNFPTGVCADNSGNIYVADDNKIRVISSASVVTTYAGTGVAGFVEGPAASAQFNVSQAVCLDGSGNVYVADKNNNKIRKICAVAPTVSAAASNTLVCVNSPVVLTGSGADTYSWYNGITNNVAFTPTATGVASYTVVGTTTSTGCSNVASVTVSVAPTPTVAVSNGTLCSGNSFTISPTGAASYTYSGGSAIVSPTATTVYTVTGSTGSCAQTQTLSLTVNTTPTVSVSGGTICSGNSFTISPTGASSYTYSGGSAIVSPAASTIYTVSGFNGSCAQTKTLSLTVNTTPTVSAGNGTICSGASFTLSPSGAATYTISGGSAIVSPNTTTSYTINGTSAQGCIASSGVVATVSVNTTPTITAANGSICTGSSFTISPSGAASYTYSSGSAVVTPTASATYMINGANGSCLSTKQVTVTVNPLPSASPNATVVNNACPNAPLTIGITGTANAYSLNGNPVTATGSITVTPMTSQTYTFVAINTPSGCTRTNTFAVNVLTNTINITSSAPNALCAGQSAVLTASVAGTPANLTWSNASVAGNTTTVTPTGTTTYTISGQDQGGFGCSYSATYTQSVSTCTSMENRMSDRTLSVYPNPATDVITVDFSQDLTNHATLQIMNAVGEIVWTEKATSGSITLKTAPFPKGIYVIKLEDQHGSAIQKFIKH